MAEISTSRVTITLGRSGQVVKRDGLVSGDGVSDSLPAAGTKRSVRDRLGSNVGDLVVHGSQFNNKRLREDSNRTSQNTNGVHDLLIGKDDLRFRLMQKNMFRQTQNDNQQISLDLREKLSRTARRPISSVDTLQHMSERKGASLLGRIPPPKSTDDRPLEPLRNSNSAWNLEQLRRRSPDRMLSTSRCHSPQRNDEELQKRALVRSYDDVRSVTSTTKNVDYLRPVSAALVSKPTLPMGCVTVRPVAPPLGQLPPPGSVVQKNSHVGDDQSTVDSLLQSLGLGKYAILFKAEEVDMTALKQMGDSDLKELGIPMGPRKKILLAIMPRSRQQP